MSVRARHEREATVPRPWSDCEMKHALELRDEGMTLAQIGARLGRSASATGGVLRRIDSDLHDSELPERRP